MTSPGSPRFAASFQGTFVLYQQHATVSQSRDVSSARGAAMGPLALGRQFSFSSNIKHHFLKILQSLSLQEQFVVLQYITLQNRYSILTTKYNEACSSKFLIYM